MSVAAAGRSAVTRPSRRTVICSAWSRTSSRWWLTKTIVRPSRGQPADGLEQPAGLLGREDGGRLVEDEDGRVAVQGAQDLDALERADGEPADARVRVDAETEPGGEVRDDRPGRLAVEQPAPPRLPPDRQVLGDGQ